MKTSTYNTPSKLAKEFDSPSKQKLPKRNMERAVSEAEIRTDYYMRQLEKTFSSINIPIARKSRVSVDRSSRQSHSSRVRNADFEKYLTQTSMSDPLGWLQLKKESQGLTNKLRHALLERQFPELSALYRKTLNGAPSPIEEPSSYPLQFWDAQLENDYRKMRYYLRMNKDIFDKTLLNTSSASQLGTFFIDKSFSISEKPRQGEDAAKLATRAALGSGASGGRIENWTSLALSKTLLDSQGSKGASRRFRSDRKAKLFGILVDEEPKPGSPSHNSNSYHHSKKNRNDSPSLLHTHQTKPSNHFNSSNMSDDMMRGMITNSWGLRKSQSFINVIPPTSTSDHHQSDIFESQSPNNQSSNSIPPAYPMKNLNALVPPILSQSPNQGLLTPTKPSKPEGLSSRAIQQPSAGRVTPTRHMSVHSINSVYSSPITSPMSANMKGFALSSHTPTPSQARFQSQSDFIDQADATDKRAPLSAAFNEVSNQKTKNTKTAPLTSITTNPAVQSEPLFLHSSNISHESKHMATPSINIPAANNLNQVRKSVNSTLLHSFAEQPNSPEQERKSIKTSLPLKVFPLENRNTAISRNSKNPPPQNTPFSSHPLLQLPSAISFRFAALNENQENNTASFYQAHPHSPASNPVAASASPSSIQQQHSNKKIGSPCSLSSSVLDVHTPPLESPSVRAIIASNMTTPSPPMEGGRFLISPEKGSKKKIPEFHPSRSNIFVGTVYKRVDPLSDMSHHLANAATHLHHQSSSANGNSNKLNSSSNGHTVLDLIGEEPPPPPENFVVNLLNISGWNRRQFQNSVDMIDREEERRVAVQLGCRIEKSFYDSKTAANELRGQWLKLKASRGREENSEIAQIFDKKRVIATNASKIQRDAKRFLTIMNKSAEKFKKAEAEYLKERDIELEKPSLTSTHKPLPRYMRAKKRLPIADTLAIQPLLARANTSSGPSLQWLDVIPMAIKDRAARKIAKAMKRLILVRRVARAAQEYRRINKMKKTLEIKRLKEEREKEEREKNAKFFEMGFRRD
eukprot:GDKJ01021466.1.p1 GENE.GDKJ01021466.1~~GDKJ01021466.1.p1  ORF type:complete len:1028 (-),score=223.24 GDKJ01021466.1:37-3120(-)